MRSLYSGQLKKVTMLIRRDHMDAATVRSVVLFNCRWSKINSGGEQHDGDVTANMTKTIHIPKSELARVDVLHVNALTRFIDEKGRYWEPESGNPIVSQLWENHLCLQCRRTDPIPTIGV